MNYHSKSIENLYYFSTSIMTWVSDTYCKKFCTSPQYRLIVPSRSKLSLSIPPETNEKNKLKSSYLRNKRHIPKRNWMSITCVFDPKPHVSLNSFLLLNWMRPNILQGSQMYINILHLRPSKLKCNIFHNKRKLFYNKPVSIHKLGLYVYEYI